MATATREHMKRAFRPHTNGRLHDESRKWRQAAHDAGEEAGNYASNFIDRTRDYVDQGREYVVEHPTRSLTLAACVGVLVGMLVLALRPSRD